MKHAFFVLMLLVGSWAISVDQSLACICLGLPLAERFDEATLVFRGELIMARPHPTDRCGDETLLFVVSKVWKGEERGLIAIRSPSVGRRRDGSLPAPHEKVCSRICEGIPVEQGREYIAFALGPDEHFDFCSKPLLVDDERATEVIHALDALVLKSEK